MRPAGLGCVASGKRQAQSGARSGTRGCATQRPPARCRSVCTSHRAGRWARIVLRVWRRFPADKLTTAASSAGFYVLLGIIPGLAAVIALYVQFADPQDLTLFSSTLAELVPPRFAAMLSQQIANLVAQESRHSGTPYGFLQWLALMVWFANRGMRGFLEALNVIYDGSEERGFFAQLASTLVVTVGAIVFVALAIAAIVLFPSVVGTVNNEAKVVSLLRVARWPVLLLLGGTATALLLRFGPRRQESGWRSILLGSTITAILWIGFSAVFFWYLRSVASFSAIYGSLALVVAVMIWLWLSALALLIGAEFDAAYGQSDGADECACGGTTDNQRT